MGIANSFSVFNQPDPSVAEQTADRKRLKYAELSCRYEFHPLALELNGMIDNATVNLLDDKTSERSSDAIHLMLEPHPHPSP